MHDPIRLPGNEPDTKHVAIVTAMAAGLISAAKSTSQPHGICLDALLSAYASLLVANPCCWEGAAWGLRKLADRIDRMRLAQAAEAERQAAAAIATAAGKAA